jgi:hypothetical protein
VESSFLNSLTFDAVIRTLKTCDPFQYPCDTIRTLSQRIEATLASDLRALMAVADGWAENLGSLPASLYLPSQRPIKR